MLLVPGASGILILSTALKVGSVRAALGPACSSGNQERVFFSFPAPHSRSLLSLGVLTDGLPLPGLKTTSSPALPEKMLLGFSLWLGTSSWAGFPTPWASGTLEMGTTQLSGKAVISWYLYISRYRDGAQGECFPSSASERSQMSTDTENPKAVFSWRKKELCLGVRESATPHV